MNTKLQSKQKEPNKQKKLDSFKGFQELNAKELQEIEGGILPIVAVGLAVLYIGGTLCTLADGKKLNGMP